MVLKGEVKVKDTVYYFKGDAIYHGEIFDINERHKYVMLKPNGLLLEFDDIYLTYESADFDRPSRKERQWEEKVIKNESVCHVHNLIKEGKIGTLDKPGKMEAPKDGVKTSTWLSK